MMAAIRKKKYEKGARARDGGPGRALFPGHPKLRQGYQGLELFAGALSLRTQGRGGRWSDQGDRASVTPSAPRYAHLLVVIVTGCVGRNGGMRWRPLAGRAHYAPNG